ncbi:MAG: type II secretion system protein [Candidatus Saccharibacteria bacterium]|nr:type II secretion system protein [Candidatus Saccharibacteria bacterium]
MKRLGFTIIELMVVIIVISILATVITIGYENMQRDVRDTERAADIDVIQAALESYYDQNGAYPPASGNLEDLAKNKLGIHPNALKAPRDTSSGISFKAAGTNQPSVYEYLYKPLKNGSRACTGATDACEKYTLLWRKESDDTNTQEVRSRYGW